MRVAYYYCQERLPPADSRTNPYGPLLSAALERRGVAVEFALAFDEDFLRRNRGRIDILHLNWPHAEYHHDDAAIMEQRMHVFVERLRLARELGYTLVWTAHNLYPHNRMHQEIDHECRLALCRYATAIIAHCDVAAVALRQTFGRTENVFVIPHGHFIGVYPDTLTREEARAQVGLPPEAFVYGFFGSIQPYKGIEQLLGSFAGLDAADAWLLVAGGGRAEYHQTIRQRADALDRVILRTYARAPSEEITLVMRAADVVVLPFVNTLTSGTLTLALSWGRPVVAPALGCLPATVEPAAGILYDPARSDALVNALRAIRERDPAVASAAALASVQRFDWDDIAALTLEAYRA
jgi:beta-1,4-mannosyltransferase